MSQTMIIINEMKKINEMRNTICSLTNTLENLKYATDTPDDYDAVQIQ